MCACVFTVSHFQLLAPHRADVAPLREELMERMEDTATAEERLWMGDRTQALQVWGELPELGSMDGTVCGGAR